MELIEALLCILALSQVINFYMILRMNNRLNMIIEKIDKHQQTLELLMVNLDKSMTRSNEYLYVIAKKNGYV
jgi:fatty acid-binding protein DegV